MQKYAFRIKINVALHVVVNKAAFRCIIKNRGRNGWICDFTGKSLGRIVEQFLKRREEMRHFQILTATLMLFAGLFSVEVAQASWKISSVDIDGKTATRHTDGVCIVDAHENGKLEISALDDNWHGRAVFQFIEISPNGTMVENIESVKIEDIDASEGDFILTEFKFEKGGYDVFFEKCKNSAEGLPPEVKKLFRGYWGIK